VPKAGSVAPASTALHSMQDAGSEFRVCSTRGRAVSGLRNWRHQWDVPLERRPSDRSERLATVWAVRFFSNVLQTIVVEYIRLFHCGRMENSGFRRHDKDLNGGSAHVCPG